MTRPSLFRFFKTRPEIIGLAFMLYVRFPFSLRNLEDPLQERRVDTSRKTVRYTWHRFGPMFAAELWQRRIERVRSSRWQSYLDETFVKINGVRHHF